MTQRLLRTRRMLLKDMGKAGAAVMVFGIAACSTESSATTSTAGPEPSTTRPSTPTTEAAVDSTSTTAMPAGHSFQRVDMGFVSAYILFRNGEAALVDTGVSNSESDIEAALSQVGLGWDAVGHVIVTHEHPDHQGSLPAVLSASDAVWYAGAGDMASIAADGGVVVAEGDTVFNLQIIETPGHTPGHISVLDTNSGVLVTGDAINGTDGTGATGANPRFTPDMDTANDSVRKLAAFDYEIALFGHGEPLLADASSVVAALAESL